MPKRFHAICALAIFLGNLDAARALIVDNAPVNDATRSSSTFNFTAPSNGSPWLNVGNLNGAGGVYLGNGWVITAGHVGPGTIDFGISVGAFNYDGTSMVTLKNPSNNLAADLILFHLPAFPNLPSLTLTGAT